MRTYVFDCETTGLNFDKDAVVEVGWVELVQEWGDWTLVNEFYSLVKSPVPISDSASGIHGIRADDLINSPTIDEIPFPRGPIRFVSHNTAFDLKFLRKHMQIEDELCTLTLARRLIKNMENYKLGTLSAACSLSRGITHRAQLDAINSGELLIFMLQGTGWSIEKMSAYYKKPHVFNSLMFGKHKDVPLDDVPLSYLAWLSKQDLDRDTRTTVDYYLRRK